MAAAAALAVGAVGHMANVAGIGGFFLQKWCWKRDRMLTNAEITRDHIRDARDMRNEQLQTLLVMDTLLFGIAFAVLVEGTPPEDTNTVFLVVYHGVLAAALSANVASMYYALLVVNRVLNFRVDRPRMGADVHPPIHDRAQDFDHYYLTYCLPTEMVANGLYHVTLALTMLLGVMLVLARAVYHYKSCLVGFVFFGVLALAGKFLWENRDHGEPTEIEGFEPPSLEEMEMVRGPEPPAGAGGPVPVAAPAPAPAVDLGPAASAAAAAGVAAAASATEGSARAEVEREDSLGFLHVSHDALPQAADDAHGGDDVPESGAAEREARPAPAAAEPTDGEEMQRLIPAPADGSAPSR
eukprot:TRINITY_DN15022_c0_g1_i1.p1 TRINITY_DN15022_c0_g1~~TRINITY_DN15022_c0_g1_i1.p1  ORF type:complete len:381 (+),score=122.38 TRINITY_DN15022_c0_g1_i1:83-1144(+)